MRQPTSTETHILRTGRTLEVRYYDGLTWAELAKSTTEINGETYYVIPVHYYRQREVEGRLIIEYARQPFDDEPKRTRPRKGGFAFKKSSKKGRNLQERDKATRRIPK